MQTLSRTLHDKHWAAKCWPANMERRSCNRRPRKSNGIKFEQWYVSGPFGSGIFFFYRLFFGNHLRVHFAKGWSVMGIFFWHFHIDQPTGFLDSRLGEGFLAASMVKAWRRQGETDRNRYVYSRKKMAQILTCITCARASYVAFECLAATFLLYTSMFGVGSMTRSPAGTVACCSCFACCQYTDDQVCTPSFHRRKHKGGHSIPMHWSWSWNSFG